jgi:hypothetical protein
MFPNLSPDEPAALSQRTVAAIEQPQPLVLALKPSEPWNN